MAYARMTSAQATTSRARRLGWLSSVAFIALVTSACSGGGSSSAGTPTSPSESGPTTSIAPSTGGTSTSSGTGSPTSPTSSSPSGTPTTGAPTPAPCRTSDLAVVLRGSQAAAGSTFSHLVLTNTTGHSCVTGGFAGVSYVGGGNGTQIGAPARRVSAGQSHPLVLQPGGRALATLQQANAANYPSGRCQPTHADGLRVYPPNQTAAVFLRQPTLACAKRTAHLLSIAPFRAG